MLAANRGKVKVATQTIALTLLLMILPTPAQADGAENLPHELRVSSMGSGQKLFTLSQTSTLSTQDWSFDNCTESVAGVCSPASGELTWVSDAHIEIDADVGALMIHRFGGGFTFLFVQDNRIRDRCSSCGPVEYELVLDLAGSPVTRFENGGQVRTWTMPKGDYVVTLLSPASQEITAEVNFDIPGAPVAADVPLDSSTQATLQAEHVAREGISRIDEGAWEASMPSSGLAVAGLFQNMAGILAPPHSEDEPDFELWLGDYGTSANYFPIDDDDAFLTRAEEFEAGPLTFRWISRPYKLDYLRTAWFVTWPYQ